ncbi:alanyl-tRNA editing protein [Candidatus Woesearchaeota archaeon]|nr:alanyl-tRNA editing protein [Candidatus Woesearchaeota archaeon]
MTEQLYLSDCYLKEFDASVVGVDGRQVELDRTAFYPDSGGQPDDTGIFTCGTGDFIVSCVSKDKGRIVHVVDREGIRIGSGVHGQIDWVRRYVHMRYHTAAHLLAGIIHNETGAVITGNRIGSDGTRIDFNLGDFDRDLLKGFEKKANEAIASDFPVLISFLSREDALKIPDITKLAMGLPESIKNVRLVTIKGFGREACGGTHLSSTGEAGRLEIYDFENKGKNNRRIYFKLKCDD